MTNTLSAERTYKAADWVLEMLTPFKTSCILSVSSASTITIPFDSEPERMYVPSSLIVTVFSVMDTASDSQEEPLSAREMATLSDSSYPTSLSRSENISEVSISVTVALAASEDSVLVLCSVFCCVLCSVCVLQPDNINVPIMKNNKTSLLRIKHRLL